MCLNLILKCQKIQNLTFCVLANVVEDSIGTRDQRDATSADFVAQPDTGVDHESVTGYGNWRELTLKKLDFKLQQINSNPVF